MIKTSCKNCIFAKVEGEKQIGCSAGVLDIFKGTKKEEQGFFVLEDFSCRRIRPHFWGKDLSENEQIQKIQEENTIDMAAAVIITNQNLDLLSYTIDKIINQTVEFKQLIFVNSFNNREIFSKILKLITDKKIKTQWSLKQIVDQEIIDQYAIDLAFMSSKSLFVAKIICGENIPENFVEKIDEYHKNMNKFLVLKPKNKLEHCLVVQRFIYDMVQGNATVEWYEDNKIESDMVTKMEQLAKNQDADWAIRNISEVCDCFQQM